MRRAGGFSVRLGTLAATIAVTAAVTITACSGSKAVTAANAQCSTTPGVSPKALTYGLLYPASGTNSATFAPYRAGIDARLGVANAHGGVFGRQIHYAWADEGGAEATNLSAAQELVRQDKAFLVEEFGSSPQGSAPWLNQNGIPVVGTSNNLVFAQYKNMFSWFNIFTPTGSISTWGDYASKFQHVKKAAILYSQIKSEGARAVGLALRDSLKSVGIQTVMIEAEPTALDEDATAKAIVDSGADLITGFLDGNSFFEIAIKARQQKPGLKILSLVGYDPGILQAGPLLGGMSVFIGYRPFELPVPAHKEFLDAIAKYAPQLQPAANEIALIGWLDTDLLLRGLQAAGPCPTRQSFITDLRAVHDFNGGGLLTSPVDLTTSFGRLTTCYSFVKVSDQGTRFVPVGNGPLCGHALE